MENKSNDLKVVFKVKRVYWDLDYNFLQRYGLSDKIYCLPTVNFTEYIKYSNDSWFNDNKAQMTENDWIDELTDFLSSKYGFKIKKIELDEIKIT